MGIGAEIGGYHHMWFDYSPNLDILIGRVESDGMASRWHQSSTTQTESFLRCAISITNARQLRMTAECTDEDMPFKYQLNPNEFPDLNGIWL